ncbi:MAG: histidine triad nucleotide-binding protein [Gemmatimonadota bacterium]|nr:histidine triad nucleotide-binding protein [Gemmatimonadota bacterium]
MTDTCLFCRIARKEIPATIVYENEAVVAFRDIDAKAPTHVLIIPRTHVASLDDATDAHMLGSLQLAAAEIARNEGLVSGGYRTVMNNGADAGQSVFHVHLHLLGGRKLGWPPG